MRKTVSIIVPIYNREPYLKKCIESLLGQTWHNIELLIVDDHSTDSSYKLAARYARRDARVKLFRSDGQGAGCARNTGLNHASGEYIMFVDSDDYVSPEFVEKMISTLQATNADIVQCNYARVNDGVVSPYIPISNVVEWTGWEFAEQQISFQGVYTVCTVVWNKIYKRTVWENLRFDEVHRFEDVYTSYRAIYPCKQIVFIPDVLYYWVIHEDSTSLSDMKNENCIDIIRAWEEKTEYLKNNQKDELVRLNCRRCYYVASQFLYLLKKNHLSAEAIAYCKTVINKYFFCLFKDRKWSKRTRLRMLFIRLFPELFGKVSLKIKIDFDM